MVGQQRQVQAEREPLGRAQEHHAEEEVDEVLREDQLREHRSEERGQGVKQQLPQRGRPERAQRGRLGNISR